MAIALNNRCQGSDLDINYKNNIEKKTWLPIAVDANNI